MGGCRLGSGKWRSENGRDRWNRGNERERRRLGSGKWRSENGRDRWNREYEREGRRLGSGKWRSENRRDRWNREYERQGRRLGSGRWWSENSRDNRWKRHMNALDVDLVLVSGGQKMAMIDGTVKMNVQAAELVLVSGKRGYECAGRRFGVGKWKSEIQCISVLTSWCQQTH